MKLILPIIGIVTSLSVCAQVIDEEKPWEIGCDTLVDDSLVLTECLSRQFKIADSILMNLDGEILKYFSKEINREQRYLAENNLASKLTLEKIQRSLNGYRESQGRFVEYRKSVETFVFNQYSDSTGARSRQVVAYKLGLTIDRIMTLQTIKDEMLW